jgi:hypothetical protein
MAENKTGVSGDANVPAAPTAPSQLATTGDDGLTDEARAARDRLAAQDQEQADKAAAEEAAARQRDAAASSSSSGNKLDQMRLKIRDESDPQKRTKLIADFNVAQAEARRKERLEAGKKAGVEYLKVKSGLRPTPDGGFRVALSEKDERHPDGEVFIDDPLVTHEVARTADVNRKIRAGELLVV